MTSVASRPASWSVCRLRETMKIPSLPCPSSALLRRLVVAFALCGCASQPTAETADLAAEASVKPGINDSFFADGATDQYVERFETESREIYARRDAIVVAVGLEPGMAVADVGSGTGLFLGPFSEAVGAGGRVFAVDIVPGFVEFITNRIRRSKLSNVTPILCSAKSTELPEASVDMVFVCDTYHHFEFPHNTLASIHRALRPDGQLVVIDFHRIEGKTREWTMQHVRAGEDVFTKEIESAGFTRVERRDDLLAENYFLRFRRAAQ